MKKIVFPILFGIVVMVISGVLLSLWMTTTVEILVSISIGVGLTAGLGWYQCTLKFGHVRPDRWGLRAFLFFMMVFLPGVTAGSLADTLDCHGTQRMVVSLLIWSISAAEIFIGMAMMTTIKQPEREEDATNKE